MNLKALKQYLKQYKARQNQWCVSMNNLINFIDF